ncbi:MAG: hypothetical protein Ct9H300mP11_32420 [Chloroflexota bacterium]|nr:MAG: hypothetical protein Ct9H300mP11_32420 [Chloroflexota bacterium]
MEEIRAYIEKIHSTPHKAVVAVSGAGTQAVAWLLGVPGASRTILEALVPYGRESMNAFPGFEPNQSRLAKRLKTWRNPLIKRLSHNSRTILLQLGSLCGDHSH